jgi:peptidylprolyl isomerase
MRQRKWLMRGGAAAMLCATMMAQGLAQVAPPPTAQEAIDRAPPAAWRDVPAEDLLVMTLGDGARVSIQLASLFAPVHVANIRALVRAKRFDGGAIVRVQDNYVVQWAVADGGVPPAGFVANPPPEYDVPATTGRFRPLGFRDAYAERTGHVAGWPVAEESKRRWLIHCYGMVGVGRDMPPDTGSGVELYAVIGHAPRHLDRNIALVGRVLEGIDGMAARPRGTEEMGFYKSPAERVTIRSARIASDLGEGERPAFQLLDSDSASFAAWADARANRRDAFFVRPAGSADICNVMTPIRKRP